MNEKEQAVLNEAIEYLNESVAAIEKFRQTLVAWRDNGCRERVSGDFDSAYRKLYVMVGGDLLDGYADVLKDILTGIGLPEPEEYKTDAEREAAMLKVIFG